MKEKLTKLRGFIHDKTPTPRPMIPVSLWRISGLIIMQEEVLAKMSIK